MKPSKTLERQVHRIHELIEGFDSEVKWNDHVPDPDTYPRKRQIDVTILKDGKLTLVECRKRRRRQDVHWIEELYGRRQSCNAETVIAVAQEGFTINAQRKAERFGVILRDLQPLSDTDVANWGGQITLTLHYYQYSDVKLAIGFAQQCVLDVNASLLIEELRSRGILPSAFETAARKLDSLNLLGTNDIRTYRFKILYPEPIDLSGELVGEISLEGKVRLVEQRITSPRVLGYGDPTQAAALRKVIVEQFEGEATIVHDSERIAIDIDLSALALPPLSQPRYFRVQSVDEVDHERFALTNADKLGVAGPLTVDLYEIRA